MYYEIVMFESKEAYRAVANSPEQDARYRQLLQLLEAAPEWHNGGNHPCQSGPASTMI